MLTAGDLVTVKSFIVETFFIFSPPWVIMKKHVKPLLSKLVFLKVCILDSKMRIATR